ncbi:hypothetical protein D6C77_09352 [Aureobasidium pullulans]|nr:hypothetical protein D6C77_09352 [Aureobasidium pullulans]
MSAVTRYRPETSKLSSLDDASPAEKQRFVTYFDLTRKETFTPRLLRVGWNASKLPRQLAKDWRVRSTISSSNNAGHAIDSLDASHLTTKRHTKVPVIPNTQLASIDNITMAKQAQAVLEAQEAEK